MYDALRASLKFLNLCKNRNLTNFIFHALVNLQIQSMFSSVCNV